MTALKVLIVAIFCLISPVLSQSEDTDDVTVETVDEPQIYAKEVHYESPTPSDKSSVYFAEHFDDAVEFEKKWVKSRAKKEDISEDIAKYNGEWAIESPVKGGFRGDLGLVLKSKAKHSAIASKLWKPFVFDTKPLIVQYEVILQDGQECGGSYLKLLSGGSDLGEFHDKSPYSIMFGPDKCGNDHKLHFIFKHKNPLNGTVTEKHAKKPKERIEDYFSDKLPHLYTLILKPDNTFEISVDNKPINSGHLLEDFEPPVNPPETIADPTDKKPDDWDEREKIPDPNAVKPDDWDEDAPAKVIDEHAVKPAGWLEDEPEYVPDENAKRPDDWDEEVDGEWEPPLVNNPACADAAGCGPWSPPMVDNENYKGKWRAPLIDNPNYKGKWKAREVPNPDFFNDSEPFRMFTVTAIGFELWTMSKDILFDNILITDDLEVAKKWAADTFDKKRQKLAEESVTLWGRMMRAMNYRPKSWALYFVYCSIPICVYVWYLWSCVKEESVVQKLANITNEYPFLWFVYIGIVVLVVLVVVYLCQKPSAPRGASGGGEADELYRAEAKKKTDEVTEDDKEPILEEEKDDEYAEKHSGSEEEEDEDEAVEDVAETEGAKEKETARKRKVRKE